jgi:hypothetical protein
VPRLHLTDMAVRRLKPSGKQVIYWDTTSPIALRVSQAGGKSFMVVVGPERKKFRLGKVSGRGVTRRRAKPCR